MVIGTTNEPAMKSKDAKSTNVVEIIDTERGRDERLSVLKTYKLYIDGQFPRTESGRAYPVTGPNGTVIANACWSSRKDLRNSVVAARKALPGWSERSGYNRGQILYRIAENLEGRREQFVSELTAFGLNRKQAGREVDVSIDRLVHFAGWTDKYLQVFGTVNPVASSHFNFSVLEPMGVVAATAPRAPALLGFVSVITPIIAGGNTCVVVASYEQPLPAITLGEVLHASDLPAGVVNILTGPPAELIPHAAGHMDVNAIVLANPPEDESVKVRELSIENLKRVHERTHDDWHADALDDPYEIVHLQETKSIWHPIGM